MSRASSSAESSSAAEGRDPGRRPVVALVGRPNVGKSSLFNRILGERRAIVEPTAGVTRDRLVLPALLPGPERWVDVMDTGGIGIVDEADLARSVEVQVQSGIHAADLVLFLVDAREGPTPLDAEVARQLRRAGAEVLLVANKCETEAARGNLLEFTALGFGEPHPVSAQEGRGLLDLYDRVDERLPPGLGRPPAEDRLRLAILGRRNVGKSSFVNALLGEERVVVSDLPGTTRDAVDVDVDWKVPLTLVDTAGLHRKGSLSHPVQFFSLTRSDQALRRADVALLFLDATEGVARLDQGLGRAIRDRYKPTVVVATKCDLVPEMRPRDFRDRVEHQLPHLKDAPIVLTSSPRRRGLTRVLDEAVALHEEASRSVGTGELNRVLERIMDRLRFRGRSERPRIFYGTQIQAAPPTFLLFVNRKRLFTKEALRALQNALKRELGFPRVPVRIVLRERERSPSKKG